MSTFYFVRVNHGFSDFAGLSAARCPPGRDIFDFTGKLCYKIAIFAVSAYPESREANG